ncbi:uncharacterized protein LOC128295457 [Gossypium arboreum]|uniref:uncharacterized protein LOC128295457 n=1 Tax=Gossypium arboreum TaxID=29729 RepID=UPI0022F16245|nr:uncharacterized protein LOC128295457 [Gossypium arboreum]
MSYGFFFRKTFSKLSLSLAPFIFLLLHLSRCFLFRIQPVSSLRRSSSSHPGSRYYRSTETIHRYFRVVLRAVLKLYKLVVRLPDESTPSEIRNNPRFYPYFKDCIGALDGTHVRASVPLNIQGRFRSRKGGTTQNVLAAITFDLKFSYVLAGWEGSAHDSRILSDALSRPRGLKIPEGKYYLVDAGYGIRNGYITPYRGVRYHLKVFSAQGPENKKELFNLRHSSLRITIERVFGILKKRFRVLDAEPFWNFQTQGESGFGWDDNMKMITCDRATYDAAVMICENEATEEVRTNVSSSGTSKRKRKKAKESVEDEQIKLVSEQLGEIANALQQFTADKTPHLYKEVMSMEVE